ncbi:MAG: RNA polymerase sigma factor [Acidimicrobiales bacterium]
MRHTPDTPLSALNGDTGGEPVLLSSSSSAGRSEPDAVFIASFAEFYEVHHSKIAKSLAMTFGDAELGREAADEAMTRAYSNWGTVSGHSNPAGWVYRVGLNWGRSWYRRASRKLPWLDRTSTELPETSDPALNDALSELDPKHRAVVVCRYFLDWSTNQTAAALDIPAGTVKSRLHQALSELRGQLEEEPASPPIHDNDQPIYSATTHTVSEESNQHGF